MKPEELFQQLEEIHHRPRPFELYTARDLWTDKHISEHMLRLHLDHSHDIASRSAAFMDRSVRWIAAHFGVSSDTAIADFGCGPGLYAARLARQQARVTGIDFSRRSIDYAVREAEKHGQSIRYVNDDYLEFETDERYDLILMIACDFCALSPEQRGRLLSKFYELLMQDGHVLLDVYSAAQFEQRQESMGIELDPLDGFWSPNRHYELSQTFKYEVEKLVLDKYTIVESTRVRTIYNWLQCFDREGLESEFAASGLEITEIYSDVAGAPFDSASDEFAIVARRKQ